jgi:hypothetical protein
MNNGPFYLQCLAVFLRSFNEFHATQIKNGGSQTKSSKLANMFPIKLLEFDFCKHYIVLSVYLQKYKISVCLIICKTKLPALQLGEIMFVQ